MKRWSWQRTRALVLAVLLGLGMSLSCAQGGVMAAQMAVAADGADHSPGDCDGCHSGDHEGIVCLVLCGTGGQGLMQGDLLPLPSASRTDFQIDRLHLSSQFHSPDHGPPKILTLG